MSFLLDTGILLRFIDENDSQHSLIQTVVGMLGDRNDPLYITTQNIAELWNVATRPITNNGLALLPAQVAKLYDEAISPICAVLTEAESQPEVFQRLLKQYDVVGKQVHDARLVASVLTWQIDGILTLNERNFRRYEPEGIAILTPLSIVSPPLP
jgi:predicted nucleic acid-binding protein